MTHIDFGFTKWKSKVTRVTFVKYCKQDFCSLSWELFITKLLYFTCWLVLVRTRVQVFESSLGQRSMLHGSLVINYVNSFYWTSKNYWLWSLKSPIPYLFTKSHHVNHPTSIIWTCLKGSLYIITFLWRTLFDRRHQGRTYVSLDSSC